MTNPNDIKIDRLNIVPDSGKVNVKKVKAEDMENPTLVSRAASDNNVRSSDFDGKKKRTTTLSDGTGKVSFSKTKKDGVTYNRYRSDNQTSIVRADESHEAATHTRAEWKAIKKEEMSAVLDNNNDIDLGSDLKEKILGVHGNPSKQTTAAQSPNTSKNNEQRTI